jgi:hypothetical protein
MRLNNWSIAASYDTAPYLRRLRLRLLHREQVDHLAPAPQRLVLRQRAGVGALLGIDPAFQAARLHAVLLFGRNPLIDSSLHLLTAASGRSQTAAIGRQADIKYPSRGFLVYDYAT